MSDLVNPSKKIVRNDDVGLIEEMVWESLLLLPVKTLMRCKCLSKDWKEKIESAAFAKQYKGGFRGLLVVENNIHRLDVIKHFFYLPLEPPPPELAAEYPSALLSHHMSVRASEFGWQTMGYTGIVNGFVCFYSGMFCYLFNVATREKIPLPVSEDEKDTFHLGFDPISKVYKVLKLRVAYQDGYNKEDSLEKGFFVENLASQILSIDMDSEDRIVIEPQWRTIEGPPSLVGTESLIIGDREHMERCLGDGHMYWFIGWGVIVDFSLVEEKFEVITPPIGKWTERFNMPMFGRNLMIMGQYDRDDMGFGSVHPYVREIGAARWGECWNFPKAEWDEEIIDVQDLIIDPPRPIGLLPNGKVVVYNEDPDKTYPAPLSLFDPDNGVHSQMVVNVEESYPILVQFISMHEIFYIEENIRSLKLGG